MRKLYVIAGFAGLLGAAACSSDVLTVPNNNNPDAARVLARPSDVESLIAGSFNAAWNGTTNTNGVIAPLLVMSFENSSSLANFNMGTWGSLPRNPINNKPGSVFSSADYYNFRNLSSAARTAASGLERVNAAGFTLGSAALNARAKAFGFFVMGYANGYNALVYDSIPLVTEKNGDVAVPPLIYHDSAVKVALNQLDSAIVYAATMTALPGSATNWIPGSSATGAQFTQLLRSYKAYFRAEEPRTPAARAALNWTAIRDDASNGITSDFIMATDPSKGWDYSWYAVHFNFDAWHQQSPLFLGMADSTAAWDAYLATSFPNKTPFLIRSKDQRLPPGDTRAAQQAASTVGTKQTPSRPNLYFRNRTQNDPPGDPWALSFYDWFRMQPFKDASDIGNFPLMERAQNDLLAAEAFYRLGDFTNAAKAINVTRQANGVLPAVLPVAGTIPGGASCVPRVPDPAQGFAKSKCGDMFEALKWEKRMETAFMTFGAWFFDSRGWGDLAIGTVIEWPVPFQEMQVRGENFYDSQSYQRTTAVGTYGY